jgi:hypothetical protein
MIRDKYLLTTAPNMKKYKLISDTLTTEQYKDDEDNLKVINSLKKYVESITSHFDY